MENWRFKAKSITKFNPKLKENSIEIEDDWTSYSDIGKNFNANKLSYLDYLSTEKRFINACLEFLKLSKSNKFEIIELHKISESKDFKKNEDDKILLKYYKNLKENTKIDIIHINYYIQLVLREYASFAIKIDEKTNSLIYFGYDYHMYFVSDIDLSIFEKDILALNIFIS